VTERYVCLRVTVTNEENGKFIVCQTVLREDAPKIDGVPCMKMFLFSKTYIRPSLTSPEEEIEYTSIS
jgi:hypothetical protein